MKLGMYENAFLIYRKIGKEKCKLDIGYNTLLLKAADNFAKMEATTMLHRVVNEVYYFQLSARH